MPAQHEPRVSERPADEEESSLRLNFSKRVSRFTVTTPCVTVAGMNRAAAPLVRAPNQFSSAEGNRGSRCLSDVDVLTLARVLRRRSPPGPRDGHAVAGAANRSQAVAIGGGHLVRIHQGNRRVHGAIASQAAHVVDRMAEATRDLCDQFGTL